MSDFQQQALTLAASQHSPEWLADLRVRGADIWSSAKWPTRKTELWKYTPLTALQNDNPAQWAQVDNCAWQQAIDPIELDATRLVFINGHFSAEHSSELPVGVVCFANADTAQQALIRQHLGTVANTAEHLFAALSNAWVADGILLHVPRGTKLEKPVYILNVATPEAQPAVSNQRVLVLLEDSSQAELIEHYVSGDEQQNLFVNSHTEIVVGNNAQLQHYRINLEQEDLLHVGGVHVNLHRDARLHGFTLAQGSRLKRIDYHVNMRGEGAHLELHGVYLPRNKQLIDYHTNVEHRVPNCTSNEVFRGIIGDSAKAVFNGRIHIHPQAQKTLAELSNKNLLTSPKAEINTKPELEIYADDVRCAHGATISQLDETSVFYLQSRGVTRTEAIRMLSFGFINELLNQVPEQAIQDYLRPRLTTLFGQGDEQLGQLNYD
ncbi:Iron-regulated ABC transporter permease protein SufD [Halopseudomonas litoralis]|uniref:Iron-regulated ABC transporter permease protein SufD n=1 Tax=Halopseudomonas litoralis TaxID=797277 RepID=A0A1H1RA64_9GAMM|nr:Fe-S cluster assembly protein SufD [Halopseudomonas litoralis]SDS32667.1 Iron-regulated ABC transporter permease protein SufD [Halopseudomonas litoralis]